MNDLNLKECKFSVNIVPYIYGEMSAGDNLAFESHLQECVECTDEFAAVSNARYEVYDWKKLEFDPLSTPVIVVPIANVEKAVSWIERLREAFARPWAVPAAAFATLAVISAIYFSGSGDEGVARNELPAPTSVTSPVVLPDRADDGGLAPPVDVSQPDNAVRLKPPIAKVTASRRTTPTRTTRRPEATRTIETQPTLSQDIRAPRLNEFNDEEDTSLRLAMLFEDVDTRR